MKYQIRLVIVINYTANGNRFVRFEWMAVAAGYGYSRSGSTLHRINRYARVVDSKISTFSVGPAVGYISILPV